MNELKSIYENYLISLKVPAPWLIIKNDLINISDLDIVDFDADQLFTLKEVFFKYDIFHSRYYCFDSPYELNIVVYNVSGAIDKNSSYEIVCSLFRKSKQLYRFEKKISLLESLITILNRLHLNITYEIETILDKKNYNRIAELIL